MKKGSYTIEASLVMSLICILILCFLFLTLYLHDKAVLHHLAVDYLESTSQYLEEPIRRDGSVSLERLAGKRLLGKEANVTEDELSELCDTFIREANEALLITDMNEVRIGYNAKEIYLIYDGAMRIKTSPLIGRLLSFDTLWNRRISIPRAVNPENFLRAFKGIIQ